MKSIDRDNPERYGQWREILASFRRAFAALAVAVGFAAVGVSGRMWAFIPAVVAALLASADAYLAWREYRAARSSQFAQLLLGEPCRAREARAAEYGVDTEALPEGQAWHYVRRDFEQKLRAALLAAMSGSGPRLVMLSGEPKSGKTRSAFQALGCEELEDSWLLVPRDGASVEALLPPGAVPPNFAPLIVWLDDIERYASADANGLRDGVLRKLVCDRPLALLATEGGRGTRSYGRELMDPVAQLRGIATCIEVPVKLSGEELARAASAYRDELAEEIGNVGIGRRMVAVDELTERLTRPRDRCREGIAVIRAAIDWRRAGVLSPLSASQLEELYRHYLPDDLDPSGDLFASGLRWAREPLPNTEISLLRRAIGAADGYDPYDLAVEVASRKWPELTQGALNEIAALASATDCFQMASAALDRGEATRALDLLARAEHSEDRRLSAAGAFNTAILLERAGDSAGARAAYTRADERGSLRGAFNLGQLLRREGQLGEAEAAYGRADERGSPEGAVNHGFLLEGRGDLAGAEAAYRRAAQRGSRRGAGNLDGLLKRGGGVTSEAALDA
jgi:tetratricopeptide (TPR) repeat protein